MKALKIMTVIAASALLLASCGKDKGGSTEPVKPVVTESMYSVTADAASGAVTFVFRDEALTPFWKVVAPSGAAVDLGADVRSKNFTRTFSDKGLYTGTLIAFGDGGQSDPVAFSFSVGGGDVVITDPEKSAAWNILTSKTWKLFKYGYWGPEWEDSNIMLSLGIPSVLADDRLTFKADGSFVLDQGADKTGYDDSQTGGIPAVAINITGNEKWSLEKDGTTEYIQFSNGGFPSMLFGEASVNARWDIYSIDANQVRIQYQYSEGEYRVLFLVDGAASTGGDEPAGNSVSKQVAEAFITGHSFKPAYYGYWGEGWEYYEDSVPDYLADDVYTFSSDGKFIMELGETAHVVNDAVAGGVDFTPTGNETWTLGGDSAEAVVEFGGGAFPGTIPGIAEKFANDSYGQDFGIDAKWIVTKASDGELRLEIYQVPQDQWFVCVLSLVR